MRRAAVLLLGVCLLWPTPKASATEHAPVGWASTGSGTDGGAGGRTWTVDTRAELKAALANDGDPTAPKVIRVVGDISGHEADDGSLLGEQDYAPGYDLGKYMSCFGEDGSDLVTVSDSRFDDHDKALLIGSGDGRGERDRGHLKVTFARNLFSGIVQRAPRVRFGQVHVVNNVHRGRAPLYALGVGVESAIFSERNVFRCPGGRPSAVVADYGGERFRDTGSWFNGRPARLNDVASGLGLGSDVGWDPADVYDYRALTSPAAVERYVLRHAGAGRPYGRP
ncbi:hypothetical protein OG873_09345 [Streptomyces violaceus]|uniref:pectate lyase family protein n=1 Tax=Streptomyces violaceus TaxID=1936 RepID=UPI002E2DAAF6|nr:hypothetical protein [Streptomyces violaceus]